MQLFVNTDGGSRGNPGIAGFGLVISDHQQNVIHTQAKFLGIRTNNEAEYSGLISALEWLVENQDNYPISQINFISDSQLMVRQLQGVYKVKAPTIIPLYNTAVTLLKKLKSPYQFTDVRRESNKLADKLANEAMDSAKL